MFQLLCYAVLIKICSPWFKSRSRHVLFTYTGAELKTISYLTFCYAIFPIHVKITNYFLAISSNSFRYQRSTYYAIILLRSKSELLYYPSGSSPSLGIFIYMYTNKHRDVIQRNLNDLWSSIEWKIVFDRRWFTMDTHGRRIRGRP